MKNWLNFEGFDKITLCLDFLLSRGSESLEGNDGSVLELIRYYSGLITCIPFFLGGNQGSKISKIQCPRATHIDYLVPLTITLLTSDRV